MSITSIYAFVEGVTEVKLLHKIGVKEKGVGSCKIINCKGKDNIPVRMAEILGGVLGSQPIGALVMVDRDHDKTHDGIIKSYKKVISDLLSETFQDQELAQHPKFENLSTMGIPTPDAGFRAALHIAAPPPISDIEFASDTIDGYILYLAMNEAVLGRFAKKAGIVPEALRAKVIEKVPKLAEDNGIKFDQAKDFLGVYMAMSKFLTINRSEKDDVFSGVVADRAKKYANAEFWDVFRSIQVALQFIGVEVGT